MPDSDLKMAELLPEGTGGRAPQRCTGTARNSTPC